jgi:hypothetical protein
MRARSEVNDPPLGATPEEAGLAFAPKHGVSANLGLAKREFRSAATAEAED